MTVTMLIAMPPMGKARPRVTKSGHAFMPSSYTKWKKDFAARAVFAWRPWPKITGPFSIKITIVTKSGKCRSDIDNCAGSILDALQDAKLIGNDRDCRELSVSLRQGKVPVIAVTIHEVGS